MNHFSVYDLKDRIKDLFEVVVSKECHKTAFDQGLSHKLEWHESDAPIGQSADIGEQTSPFYCHVISIYDNFIQFMWILAYSALVGHDTTKRLLLFNEESAIYTLRDSMALYLEALLMLEKEPDCGYMQASRGKILSLLHTLHEKDIYNDKIDTITLAAAYMLQHEYGHFILEHNEETPANEYEADRHAILKLLEWADTQKESEKTKLSFLCGIIISLIAAAYVNPSLQSCAHPDIDSRIEHIMKIYEDYAGNEIPETVAIFTKEAVKQWIKWNGHFKIESPEIDNAKEWLIALKPILERYKYNFNEIV